MYYVVLPTSDQTRLQQPDLILQHTLNLQQLLLCSCFRLLLPPSVFPSHPPIRCLSHYTCTDEQMSANISGPAPFVLIAPIRPAPVIPSPVSRYVDRNFPYIPPLRRQQATSAEERSVKVAGLSRSQPNRGRIDAEAKYGEDDDDDYDWIEKTYPALIRRRSDAATARREAEAAATQQRQAQAAAAAQARQIRRASALRASASPHSRRSWKSLFLLLILVGVACIAWLSYLQYLGPAAVLPLYLAAPGDDASVVPGLTTDCSASPPLMGRLGAQLQSLISVNDTGAAHSAADSGWYATALQQVVSCSLRVVRHTAAMANLALRLIRASL